MGKIMNDQPPLTNLSDLTQRLQELHQRTRETPLFNPVFQLAHDFSRALEGGEVSLDGVEELVDALVEQSLDARASRLRKLLDPENRRARLATLADKDGMDFDAFREAWSHPRMHAVFTAHPTFLLTPAQSDAVAAGALTGTTPPSDENAEVPEITLRYEHERAMEAMAHAQDARDAIVASVLRSAQQQWPDRWHELDPLPFRFATWVGYDMDGRTDITWYNSIAFQKAAQKAGYIAENINGDAFSGGTRPVEAAAWRLHPSRILDGGELEVLFISRVEKRHLNLKKSGLRYR